MTPNLSSKRVAKPSTPRLRRLARWDKFTTTELGTVEIKQAGNTVVKVHAADAASWKAINVSSVRLVPMAAP